MTRLAAFPGNSRVTITQTNGESISLDTAYTGRKVTIVELVDEMSGDKNNIG